MSPHTNAWSESLPLGSENASTTDDYLRQWRADLGERLEGMIYGFNSDSNASPENDTGIKNLKMYKQTSDPTTVTDFGHFYVKLVSGVPELFYQDDTNTTLQLTSGGDLKSTAGLVVDGASTLTGNVACAGTLDVTGNIDPTSYETTNGGFLDEDDMASDSAAKVASQQSIKAFLSAYIKLVDSKAAGTDGGTFTSGDWRKRTIAEETDIGSHCSVSSSVIVLSAGDYECYIAAPAYKVGGHQTRLRNTSAGTNLLIGTSAYSAAADTINTHSIIIGRFTVAAAQNLEIQHQCEITRSSDGMGVSTNIGSVASILTIAEFRKR